IIEIVHIRLSLYNKQFDKYCSICGTVRVNFADYRSHYPKTILYPTWLQGYREPNLSRPLYCN
ncbi:hypothetical protein, partial [Salmonella enterica]|uniref:hypothetical protein n=1 Tax=Salmonella enterica TaxID=28901 RepID=UPI0019D67003